MIYTIALVDQADDFSIEVGLGQPNVRVENWTRS